MIDSIKNTRIAGKSLDYIERIQNDITIAVLNQRILSVALFTAVLLSFYWLVIASDRYISESHIIIQRTDLSGGSTPSLDITSLLGQSGSNRSDQMLLRDYLLSVDMLKKLEAKLNLKAHYSNKQYDIFSRMWDAEPSIEKFHQHYLARTDIDFDDFNGVLVIKAQAYDAKTAYAITKRLVQEGERYMNQLAQNLARTQVVFLEDQVLDLGNKALAARQTVLDYQNKNGLVSPQAEAENLVTILAKLKQEKSELQIQKSTLQSYLVSTHPNIVMLDQTLASIEKQINKEQAKLTSINSGRSLNKTVEEYQRLELSAVLAQDIYRSALMALEKGRIESLRTIKTVSVLQSPSLPEYPIQPRRIYNTIVSLLVSLLIAGILHLLIAVIQDHKD
jgi:capsular polysaccharide transport system permease protein